jgi:tetratricopeptide (TPR) repeat protein
MKVTAALILTGLLLFGVSLNDPFHFDDKLITTDSNVTDSAHWTHFLNPFHLRQLTFFTFYLNHSIGGLDPSGYHAVNVALHIANAILLLSLLTGFVEPWMAIAAAAIFLVHPIQTEPVSYVYQRSILLACFFSLLGLIAMKNRRTAWAVVAFVLAFESKESALAVPLAVALLSEVKGWKELAPRESGETQAQESTWARPRGSYVFAILTIALAVFALALLVGEKTVGFSSSMKPLSYLWTETRVVYSYLRLLVFPHPQSLEYDVQGGGSIVAALGIVLIAVAAWRFRILSIAAFLILLAPTSSIIPSTDAMFEHRLYMPMLAFALFGAFVLSRLSWRTGVTVVVLIVLSVLTIRRETVWSSEVKLWEDTVEHAPGKPRVWFNLGGAYLDTNPDKARSAFLKALELQPYWPEALYDLGLIEQNKKKLPEALSLYQQALSQDPTYWPACNNIGNTLFAMGERTRSVEYFERTLTLNPDYWPAQYNIAVVHFMNGRFTEAVTRLKTVLDWRPDFREARYLLAASLTQTGARGQADQEWKKLGELNATESRNIPKMILAPTQP